MHTDNFNEYYKALFQLPALLFYTQGFPHTLEDGFPSPWSPSLPSSVIMQNVVPRRVASASTWGALEIHVLRPYPRPPESEALCLWHSSLCFKKPSR